LRLLEASSQEEIAVFLRLADSDEDADQEKAAEMVESVMFGPGDAGGNSATRPDE
jgi:hypothetical protein